MKKLFFVLFITSSLCAQNLNANKILKEAASKFAFVNDYTVDAKVKVTLPFVKAPEKDMKLYFKKPNKFKIDTEGFGLLPKSVFNLNPAEFLGGDFSTNYIKVEKNGNHKSYVMELKPNSDTSTYRTVTLWIDFDAKVIEKFNADVKSGASISGELTYGSEIKYGLPSQLTLTIEFGRVFMRGNPLARNNSKDKNNDGEKKENQDTKGTVKVIYSNYLINYGIDDKVFNEKKKVIE